MSFLKYRLGASEGSYFKQENDVKATQLRDRLEKEGLEDSADRAAFDAARPSSGDLPPDTLPEILRHSVPLSSRSPSLVESSRPNSDRAQAVSHARRRSAQSSSNIGLLGSAAAVPQTKFGPGKYALQFEADRSAAVSTANQLRRRPVDPAAAEATVKGLRMVARAFGYATVGVVTAAVVAVTYTFRALEIETVEDIPVKVQAAMQPRAERFCRRIAPLKDYLEAKAQQWRLGPSEADAIGGQFASVLGAKKGSEQ